MLSIQTTPLRFNCFALIALCNKSASESATTLSTTSLSCLKELTRPTRSYTISKTKGFSRLQMNNLFKFFKERKLFWKCRANWYKEDSRCGCHGSNSTEQNGEPLRKLFQHCYSIHVMIFCILSNYNVSMNPSLPCNLSTSVLQHQASLAKSYQTSVFLEVFKIWLGFEKCL